LTQSDNSSRVFCFITSSFDWLSADWLVENMKPDVNHYGMSLVVSASPKILWKKG